MALEVRKSIPKLAFLFSNHDLLGLVNFDFFAKFVTVDKFLILPSTPPPASLPPVSADIASFFLSLVTWVLKALSLVVWSIEVSGAAILLKFLINFL